MPDLARVWRSMIHGCQAVWMIFAGVLMLCAPGQWWGRAWEIVNEYPGLPIALGVLYCLLGVGIWVLRRAEDGPRSRHRRLGYVLLIGGALNWMIGVMFFLSAFTQPLAIMCGPFPLYVGAHMLIGSAAAFARVGESG